MSLAYLAIEGVRNLQQIQLSPHERYNFFVGQNGSGKTSLLEAIYLLGTSRSFRTSYYHKVVNYDKTSLTVFGKVNETAIGVQKDKDGETQIKIDGEACRQSALLARLMPLQVYHPDSFKIINAAPKIRREVLDWGVFHVKQDYFKYWAQYQRALKQRNESLKQLYKNNYHSPWDKLLSEYAANIHQMRLEYFNRFLPVFNEMWNNLFDSELEIVYYKGWGLLHEESLLIDELEKHRTTDIRFGHTQYGPHRADIIIKYRSRLVKDIFSRGQQKLVIIAIKLAQGILLSQLSDKGCIYLFDDLLAEFDDLHLEKVIQSLSSIRGQIFFTGTDQAVFGKMFSDGKMFHVKHGEILE